MFQIPYTHGWGAVRKAQNVCNGMDGFPSYGSSSVPPNSLLFNLPSSLPLPLYTTSVLGLVLDQVCFWTFTGLWKIEKKRHRREDKQYTLSQLLDKRATRSGCEERRRREQNTGFSIFYVVIHFVCMGFSTHFPWTWQKGRNISCRLGRIGRP